MVTVYNACRAEWGRIISTPVDLALLTVMPLMLLGAMAAMLAHEVKNPLSGIRGAAQLLEGGERRRREEVTFGAVDEQHGAVRLLQILRARLAHLGNHAQSEKHQSHEETRGFHARGYTGVRASYLSFRSDCAPSAPRKLRSTT